MWRWYYNTFMNVLQYFWIGFRLKCIFNLFNQAFQAVFREIIQNAVQVWGESISRHLGVFIGQSISDCISNSLWKFRFIVQFVKSPFITAHYVRWWKPYNDWTRYKGTVFFVVIHYRWKQFQSRGKIRVSLRFQGFKRG